MFDMQPACVRRCGEAAGCMALELRGEVLAEAIHLGVISVFYRGIQRE